MSGTGASEDECTPDDVEKPRARCDVEKPRARCDVEKPRARCEFVTDSNGVYRKLPKGCDRLGCSIEWQHTHADLLSVTFET